MPKRPEAGATESIALRAFAALEHIAVAPGPLSLDEFTSSLQLPKPTVYRILALLKDAGLLRREQATKRYTIGPRLTAFAVDLWRSETLRAQWHRALEDAVAETGESCNLTLLEGNRVLYLDRVETRQPLRLHLETGTRVPLHCTASGKLFLAGMSAADARRLLGDEPYERFTNRTITAFEPLQAELRKVGRSGIGTHDCELFDDSVAIAVPVLGPGGAIFAAVAVHAPSSRESIKSSLRFVAALQRAATAIAATLSPSVRPAAARAASSAAAAPARVASRRAAPARSAAARKGRA
jgi:DNA-binding IclR family transcriptional regulator